MSGRSCKLMDASAITACSNVVPAELTSERQNLAPCTHLRGVSAVSSTEVPNAPLPLRGGSTSHAGLLVRCLPTTATLDEAMFTAVRPLFIRLRRTIEATPLLVHTQTVGLHVHTRVGHGVTGPLRCKWGLSGGLTAGLELGLIVIAIDVRLCTSSSLRAADRLFFT
jgi:hypothetical protein